MPPTIATIKEYKETFTTFINSNPGTNLTEVLAFAIGVAATTTNWVVLIHQGTSMVVNRHMTVAKATEIFNLYTNYDK